ncbi:MAG TPA: SIMPL domain-containing protein [Candidatus Eisenbacteria bacterium]|nr:SIMPL domain-containing protein [Candidatus Eisenbacteria bacterium]
MNDRTGTVVLAIAIVLGGFLVGRGVEHFRGADRSVSVKGVAERTVSADIGLWPLRLVAADNDLDLAQRTLARDRRAVLAFLGRFGLDSSATELQGFEVQDTRANPYQSGAAANRFIITTTLMVRTQDPARIQQASQRVADLVAAGVVLSSGGPGFGGPTYLFTKLNDLKPEMVAEATRNARKAAEEFAKQSGSRVGGIRRASQGVFEILPRDPAPGISQEGQMQKTLRVVSTVEYQLR